MHVPRLLPLVPLVCAQALSFQVNDGEIVELSQRDCELPEEVQPWILLGHPGDEVTISEVVDVC